MVVDDEQLVFRTPLHQSGDWGFAKDFPTYGCNTPSPQFFAGRFLGHIFTSTDAKAGLSGTYCSIPKLALVGAEVGTLFVPTIATVPFTPKRGEADRLLHCHAAKQIIGASRVVSREIVPMSPLDQPVDVFACLM